MVAFQTLARRDCQMYRKTPEGQLAFEDFYLPFGGKLSGDNTELGRTNSSYCNHIKLVPKYPQFSCYKPIFDIKIGPIHF